MKKDFYDFILKKTFIYFLSGILQLFLAFSALLYCWLHYKNVGLCGLGIIYSISIYFILFIIANIVFISQKNTRWLKILDIGFLFGIIIELSGTMTPFLFGTSERESVLLSLFDLF